MLMTACEQGVLGACFATMLRPTRELHAAEQRIARMLLFSLWPDGGGFDSIDQGLDALRSEAATRDELSGVVDIAFEAARHETADLDRTLWPTSH